MISVAMLHLDLCCGPETQNESKLLDAIKQAADMGADWVITPETAQQGYFWAVDGDVEALDEQHPDFLMPVSRLAKQKNITVFFCSAERCPETSLAFNSCFVIAPNGDLIGRHRKMSGHGSTESWATHGDVRQVMPTEPLSAGVLICSDSWHAEHAHALKTDGANVLVVPAAWPPGKHGPGDCWEQRSMDTGLPVWVCNQTGDHPRLNFHDATSVVVQNGKTVLSYKGQEEAILLFNWDVEKHQLAKPSWSVVPIFEKALEAAV